MNNFPKIVGVSHSFVTAKGVKLHVAEIGKGEPLALLHGWPQHWYVWRKIIPLLKDKYKLIMPDLPGFGWSEMPKDTNFQKDALAKIMIQLIEILGLKRVGLVGHDWGGWIGFLMCLEKPELFSKYVALGITSPISQSRFSFLQSWRFLYQLPILTPVVGEYLLQTSPSLIEWGMKQVAHNKNAWTKEEIDWFSSVFHNSEKAKASSLLYRTFLMQEFLPLYEGKYKKTNLHVPTHLFIGEHDPIINPVLFKDWNEEKVNLTVIKSCGHFIPEEQPAIVGKTINNFFD